MSNDWKPYFDDRIYRDDKSVTIIAPKEYEKPVPLFCPVCEFCIKTPEDIVHYKKYFCCTLCAFKWATINSENWLAGWRPTNEEILEEIEKRKKIPVILRFE
jgi:hypothetical protein